MGDSAYIENPPKITFSVEQRDYSIPATASEKGNRPLKGPAVVNRYCIYPEWEPGISIADLIGEIGQFVHAWLTRCHPETQYERSLMIYQ